MCTLAANHPKSIHIEQVRQTSYLILELNALPSQYTQKYTYIERERKYNCISILISENRSMKITLSMDKWLKCGRYITPYLKVNEGFWWKVLCSGLESRRLANNTKRGIRSTGAFKHHMSVIPVWELYQREISINDSLVRDIDSRALQLFLIVGNIYTGLTN